MTMTIYPPDSLIQKMVHSSNSLGTPILYVYELPELLQIMLL